MDRFRKWKSLYSATSNSFGTGEGVTITPSSVAGLPEDTEITLTFDREIEGKIERIRGTIVGSNFVVASGGRGVDGTQEQSHTSPVIEHVPNGSDINDLVDGILTQHNQDGTHGDITADSITGKHIATPSNPSAGFNKLYPKSDGTWYSLQSDGTETKVGAGGGQYQFIYPGNLTTGTNVAGSWFAPQDLEIVDVSIFVDTAGATGATTIDVNKNGTTIFTDQGDRPSISNTGTSDMGNVPDVTAVSAGDKITVDIDAVTTTAPQTLYVVIRYA